MDQSAGLRMFRSDTIKLVRMDGMNFTHWKDKMKFLLTAFKVYYVLEGPPVGVMTEEEQRKRKNNKGNNKKSKGTWNSSKENKKDNKPLSEVVCYKCSEKGHIKCYCKNLKKKNQNSDKKDESVNAELHMASVITTDDWWYDSGATTYVCNNRDLFKTYKETKDGHEVIMDDNHTSKVIGPGNSEIQFTSKKKLTLMNVLHVPNIRKNLVSSFKLCKSRVKAVIESEKVILSKANVFVRKAYACDGMFKLNINKTTSSAYLPVCNFISSFNIECSTFNLWHNHLGYINYRTIKDMLKQGIIFYNGEHKDKCEICVQAKIKRKPFTKVDRQSEMLELVHSDICELNGQLTRGENRNMEESSSAPRRSESARKERNLDPDFIDSQAIIFLVEGFVLPGHENKVFKLKKSLYGLKQAPKQWHDKFDKSILSNGFTHNSSDRCIYSKFTKDYGVILYLYVDDILIVRTNMEGINETKKFLSSCFQTKDMNEGFTYVDIRNGATPIKFKTRALNHDFWTISSGLDLTYAPSTITTQQPTEHELYLLFEAMYNDYIGGQPSAAIRTASAAQAPQVLQTPTVTTTPADTAPTPTNSSSQATNIPNTSPDVDELEI
nr:hypothetical protein [Tanacetum cinerariifolium]